MNHSAFKDVPVPVNLEPHLRLLSEVGENRYMGVGFCRCVGRLAILGVAWVAIVGKYSPPGPTIVSLVGRYYPQDAILIGGGCRDGTRWVRVGYLPTVCSVRWGKCCELPVFLVSGGVLVKGEGNLGMPKF